MNFTALRERALPARQFFDRVTERISLIKYAHASALLIALYFGLTLFKMRGFIGIGRMWCEEAIFYRATGRMPWYESIFYIYKSHFEVPANVIAYLATLVPFEYAAAVMTNLSLLCQSIPVLLVIFYRRLLSINALLVAVFIVIVSGIPQSAEVLANVINLQFHFAVLAGVILCLSAQGGYPRWLFRILLGIAGMAGVPSSFVTPFYVLRACKTRDREHIVLAGISIVTAVVQLVFVLQNRGNTMVDRDISFPPVTTALAIVAEQSLSPLFGGSATRVPGPTTYVGNYYITDALIQILKQAADGDFEFIIFAILCAAPLLYCVYKAIALRIWPALWLQAASLAIAIGSMGTCIGEKINLVASNGGRYFFAPNVLFLLSALLLIPQTRSKPLTMFITLVTVTCIFGSCGIPYYLGGRPWSDTVREYEEGIKYKIEINPPGPGCAIYNDESVELKEYYQQHPERQRPSH